MEKQTNMFEAIRVIVKEETKDFATRREITEFKDQILTAIDTNNKKLGQILSEHPAMNHSIDESREEIKKHDIRIKTLETRPAFA